jgi:CHAD domain-containing protein
MAQPTGVPGLGARTKVAEAAEKLLLARAADLHREQTRAAHRLEKKAVHALRLSCRRLRAGIKLFGKKKLRRTDESVEHLQDALGEVRDLQLKIDWLVEHRADSLVRGEREKLLAAEVHLRQALLLWSLRSAPKVLFALSAVRRRGRLGGARQRDRLLTRLRRLGSALEEARTVEPGPAHALRIAAKKLRYEAEIVSAAFDVGGLIEALKELQDALGQLHDADMRVELARKDPRLLRAARRERERLARAALALVARWRQDDRVERFRKAV